MIHALNELKALALSKLIEKVETITKDDVVNYYIPIIFMIILFWPIVATLFVAASSASMWLFWILISVVFGIIQLLYVSYQFVMVSLDIFGLCLLKTYAIIRSMVRHYSTMVGIRKGKKKKKLVISRKRWKQACHSAKSFEEFRKIELLEPSPEGTDGNTITSTSNRWNVLQTLRWLGKYFKQDDKTPNKKKKKKMMRNSQSCLNLNAINSVMNENKMNNLSSSLKHSKSQDFLTASDAASDTASKQLDVSGDMLTTTTSRLREARLQAIEAEKENTDADSNDNDRNTNSPFSSLNFLLSAVVKRNHCNVDDYLIDDARSIADSGTHHLTYENRSIIESFMNEVESCLQYISSPKSSSIKREQLKSRIHLLEKMKQNTGCTALMLSGGGAQSMYHLGTIRALIESGLYDEISVISGTSGGAISAGMCAMQTSEYLLKNVCVDIVSTDYKRNGEMAKYNIRWFPKFYDMGVYWLQNKILVDSKDFKRCCDFYYSDVTFEEAYQRTGKHVCITVTASRSGSSQRLMLNHISTPHVTISSAVAASCALPGVMAPAKLEMKLKYGSVEPFEVDGTEWVDGSIQADLPFKRISTLFNISNFIVSQVNFHVVPFLNKAHHPSTTSLYWRLFQIMEWDIRSRVLNLSRLGLFPTIFGHNVSKVFKQKYHGNLTIVPRFTRMQVFGLKVLVNPTVADMKVYLQNGQSACFVYCHVIHHMIRFEKALSIAIDRLKSQLTLNINESIDGSIHNKSFNTTASNDEKLVLEEKVQTLEEEVRSLKCKLKHLEQVVAQSSGNDLCISQNGHHQKDGSQHSSSSSSSSVQVLVNPNKDDDTECQTRQQWTPVTRSRSKKCL